ncbi:MAG: dockerin type I domain-containing protein, partial [Bacteroidota bacterium]
RTDASGAYLFSGIPQGTYQMTATTNKPWGGLGAVNSSDALIMKRHFNVMTTLTGINFLAGDVNGTNIINGTDALLVHRRYVGSDNSFPLGDWAYDLPSSKQINSGQELQESNLALVYGDVNGTYTPDINL